MSDEPAHAGEAGFIQKNFFEGITPSFPLEKRFAILPVVGFCAATAVILSNKSPQALRGLCRTAIIEPASLIGIVLGSVAYIQEVTTYVYGVCYLLSGTLRLSKNPSKNIKRGLASLVLGVPLSIVAGYYCDLASMEKVAHFAALNPLRAFHK